MSVFSLVVVSCPKEGQSQPLLEAQEARNKHNKAKRVVVLRQCNMGIKLSNYADVRFTIVIQKSKKTVLFAALDWGLGHATRCIPLIDALIELGHTPILASSGHALQFWKNYYPSLQFVTLSSLDVRYNGTAWWSALLQSPFMIRRLMVDDKKLLKQYLKNNTVDFIVSDNRYGCTYPGIKAVLLSNQLDLLPPQNWSGLPALSWKIIWRSAFRGFAAPFQELWLPEFEDETLQLSKAMLYNPTKKPVRYIGLVTRLAVETPTYIKKGTLLLLSGPEPQRTELERLLLAQTHLFPPPLTLVRGNNTAKNLAPNEKVNILPEITDPKELTQLIKQHKYVVCRPGHSTLSDLYYCGAHFGVISTPGQPEQEYLAQRITSMGIAPNQEQKNINVTRLIADIDKFTGFKGKNQRSLTELWTNVLNSL